MTEQESHLQKDDGQRHAGPEKVRQAAVEAAGRLFAEKGIHGVSVREIAREVGVSHTLLHLYFGSKEEILRQVFSQYDNDLEAFVTSGADPVEGLVSAYGAVIAEPGLTRVLAAALIEGVVPDKIAMHPAGQVALAERLYSHDTKGLDPRAATLALACMAIGWSVGAKWMIPELGLDDMDPDDLNAQMVMVIRRVVYGPSEI